MKTHGIIVKKGFAVIVAFCYNICLFRNPEIMILKVVACQECVQKNKLHLWAILAILSKKIAMLIPFG